jgi:serine/threonine protein kinase
MTTATTPQAEPATIVGSTIGGRYRIVKLLGEGGMGAVYEAEHTLMHKRVAVKVLHAEMSKMNEVVARFEREAMAAAHIEHPNVASATDFGKLEDGSFFLVLEYVEGKSLREAIAEGPLPVPRAIHIARQVASALSRAHGLGIVHRDLKPENVMLVTRDADEDFVKVLDFGIAKVPVGDIAPKSSAGDQALTQLGMVYGTPEYMPPEQALGQEVDRRADLYALGVIVYEMIAGHRPFDDESKVKVLTMHITAPVPPLPPDVQAPPELEALVLRLLAKEAKDRVQEAREAIEAFDALVTPPPSVVSGGHIAVARTSGGRLPAVASGPHASLSGASHPSLPDPSQPSLPRIASGTSPTMLAVKARAQTLAGEVTRIVPPRVLAIVGGVLALCVVVTVIAIAAHGSSSSVASSASATPTYHVSHRHDRRFEHELKKARGEIAAAHYDDAITHARMLSMEQPSRPEPYHVMFEAYVAKGDTKAALSEAAQWLAVDPTAQSDAQLRDTIREAIASSEHESAAFALLESGKMGPQGADILYDIAYGPSSPGQSKARRALGHEDVTKHASPALRIALELRRTRDCAGKKELLDRAASFGDARTLSILDSYSKTSGCGFLGLRDCYGCMRKDDALASATEKLRKRLGP